MNKFLFWALIGIAVNAMAMLRGIALITYLSPIPSTLGVATAVISLIGIYASFLIIRKNAIGLKLAKRQVWGVAVLESLNLITSGNPDSNFRVVIIISGFIFAYQLSKLFTSQQAQDYCLPK